MNGFEYSKLLGALALAIVVALVAGTVAREAVQDQPLAHNAFPVAVDETKAAADTLVSSASGAPAQAQAAGPAPIETLLAKADPDAGQKAARVCGTCHNFDKGGPNKIGPNLYGIVMNHHAHAPDFKYSDAMKAKHDDVWTFDALNKYLYDPRAEVPGNRMAFAGIKKDTDRANVIAWLRTLSDKPEPLPKPAP